ncbi:MAG TPA: PKD domain-containing protein, partial [Tepidisphaeraceae bacterium]|nr:PKD domain-containing protein [Tepidisphaeraceae bacterium]
MIARTSVSGISSRKLSKERTSLTRLRAAASGVVQSMWTSAKGAVQRVLGDGDDLLLWIVERLEPRQLLSAPEITPIPPMDSTETLWFTVYTDFYDADTEDSHWGTFDWGDGSSDDAGIASSGGYGYVSGSHVYADNGVYNATLTITDSGNESSQVPFTVTVANIAPRLIIAAPSVVNEGASFSLNLASKDPGPDTISNWSINWGDGSAPQNVAGSTTSVAHVYAAGPAQRTITVTATDEDGSYVSSALAPDPSFGTVGKVTTNFGSTDLGRAVAVQPDGKVVAVGAAFISSPLSYGIGVARYLSNGTLDTTFD